MTEEEKSLSVEEENLPAAGEEKKGALRGARDFIGNTFANLRGKDLNQAVEEFTSEMTLVAEGLSEDQTALRRDVDKNAAQLTLLEDDVINRDQERQEHIDALREAIRDEKKRADSLEKRLQDMEKALEKAAKKPQKAGLGQILRQATWIVGFICIAWVLVTVLKLLGG